MEKRWKEKIKAKDRIVRSNITLLRFMKRQIVKIGRDNIWSKESGEVCKIEEKYESSTWWNILSLGQGNCK